MFSTQLVLRHVRLRASRTLPERSQKAAKIAKISKIAKPIQRLSSASCTGASDQSFGVSL